MFSFDDDDKDNARAERDFRMNPPECAPGQDSVDWGDGGATDASSFTGSGDFDVNSILNNGTGGSEGTNLNQQQQAESLTMEADQIIAVVKTIFKGITKYVSYFVESFSNNKEGDWHRYGVQIFKIASVVNVTAILLSFFKLVFPVIKQPSDLLIGGLFSYLVSFTLMYKFSKNGEYYKDTEGNNSEDINMGDSVFEDFDSSELFEDTNDLFNDGDEDEIMSDDDFDSLFEDMDNGINIFEDDESEKMSVDEAISNIPVIEKGTQTRSFLYETFLKVLPNITPNFSTMESVPEGCDEFMNYEHFLRESAIQAGTKEEDIPELLEVRKNPIITQLIGTRPPKLKEKEIADGVADMISRDDYGAVILQGTYATVDSIVGKLIINVFVGKREGEKGQMISLADAYKVNSDFIKDTSVLMPFVWGIDELGKVLYCDLKDCDSLLIAGEGRGGKSWKGQSLVAQLSMYNSPKELEFYIFDIKNFTSDYRYLSTVIPHCRYFCGDVHKINSGIKQVIDLVFNTNRTIMSAEGIISIKDYNKVHPEKKLPYRYIIIDEMLGMKNAFSKEERAEFDGYLSTIVSNMANLGLRLILFPHRVVDFIINKNTYSLISSRAVVRQLSADEVKNAVGVSEKDFPYKLCNEGDMALRTKEVSGGKCTYCHAEVLSKSNEENRDIFKYIGAVWGSLMPECECISIDGSIGGRIGSGVKSTVSIDSELNSFKEGNIEVKHEVIDHTENRQSYSYADDSSESVKVSDDIKKENQESLEDFWNSVI